jgi:hypothetical protein
LSKEYVPVSRLFTPPALIVVNRISSLGIPYLQAQKQLGEGFSPAGSSSFVFVFRVVYTKSLLFDLNRITSPGKIPRVRV